MDLGYKLKQIRNLKRLSQKEISELIDVSQKTYSNYESCKTVPSTLQLIELSDILHFDFIAYLKKKERHNKCEIIQETFISEKIKDNIISSYETILRDKDEIIKLLKDKINQLQRNNSQL